MVDFARKGESSFLNILVEKMYVFRVEWWLTKDKLKNDNSETKIICFWTHTLLLQHFRGQVCRTSAESLCKIIFSLFAEPKINQKDVAVSSQHDVFRFQVAINDAQIVKILQSQDYFSCIYPDIRLWKGEFLIHVLCHILALTVF